MHHINQAYWYSYCFPYANSLHIAFSHDCVADAHMQVLLLTFITHKVLLHFQA